MKATSVLAQTILLGALLTACGGTTPAPDAAVTTESTPTATNSADAPTPVESPSPTARATRSATPLDLTVGWPAVGSRTGARTTRPRLADRELIATGCDRQALRASEPFAGQALAFLGHEDSRRRQVARFRSRAGAKAAIAGIVAEVRSCPSRDQDGATAITDVEQHRDRALISTHYTYAGEPVVGAAALVAVRDGRVVVLSSVANQASGADGARLLADLDLPHARAILSRACAANRC